jgi:hypothetical protein
VGGPKSQDEIREAALRHEMNLRYYEDGRIGISLDEIAETVEIEQLLAIFGAEKRPSLTCMKWPMQLPWTTPKFMPAPATS